VNDVGLERDNGKPLHVAIIMDGSGRWAEARGRPRLDGHRAGALAVRRIVDAARRQQLQALTLFAFSSDNWRRPADEVQGLLSLLADFLADFRAEAARYGTRIDVIGRRDRLPAHLRAAAAAIVTATRAGSGLRLRLAIDYSARDTILRAVQQLAGAPVTDRTAFEVGLAAAAHASFAVPAVDLLIRTGGEQRLSDFLLWESAYAELYFTKKMWPEFDAADLEAAIAVFRARQRRFGCLPGAAHA
jgi:undecaprenyl diphosphate synthase